MLCFIDHRSTDLHLSTRPTVLRLTWKHNHYLDTNYALSYRKPADATVEKMKELIVQGQGAGHALGSLRTELDVEHGDHFLYIDGDGAMVPKYNWVYR